MNWKKSLFVTTVAGMMVFTMVGCSEAEEAVPATEQSTPAIEQPALAPKATRPAPPEGVVQGERPPAPAMDLVTAAAKLGVTEQQLREAIGEAGQSPLDLASVAQKLGVSEESLREALGFPEGVPPAGGPPPGNPSPGGLPPAGPAGRG